MTFPGVGSVWLTGCVSAFFPMGRQTDRPWFRIGRFEVGTTVLVSLLVVVSWLLFVVSPALVSSMVYSPWLLARGEVWTLITWPFANPLSLFGILNLLFFWMFGSELEQYLGRNKMALLIGGIWATMTLVYTGVGLGMNSATALAGIGTIQFVIFLLWIAENPRRPFFFGIPMWVVGAVLLGFQLLSLLAARATVALISLLISLAVIAMLARRLGLLRSYAWIPGDSTKRRAAKVRRNQVKVHEDRAKDDARLDELLTQIHQKGMDSLSASQRRELMKLRTRLSERL